MRVSTNRKENNRRHLPVVILSAILALLIGPAWAQVDPEPICKTAGCGPGGCPAISEAVQAKVALDLSEWEDCDVCCIDNTGDLALTNAETVLKAGGVCPAGSIVKVGNVAACNAAVAAAGGNNLNVCLLGHGAAGIVSMGAGTNANNGLAGGLRDDLDSVSKPAFVAGLAGNKVDRVHIFACSTGADWEFVDWLATDLQAQVDAATTPIQTQMDDGAGGTELGLWITNDGTIHTARAKPHEVWDFIWDQRAGGPPISWSEGIWTRNGTPMPECTTFPGGVGTLPPPDIHISDHKICPNWPNDWHWSVVIDGVTCHIWVHWDGLSSEPQIEVQIPAIPQDFTLNVDLAQNQYTITEGNDPDGTGVVIVGPTAWSGFPGNLPPAIGVVDGVIRMTGEEESDDIPALSGAGLITLIVMLAGLAIFYLGRRAKGMAQGA